MLGLLLCSALALSADAERPSQAYAHALIAEMHIARGEWPAAEAALRYALVFDYDDRYLRGRLAVVLDRQGKRAWVTKAAGKLKKTLRLPERLTRRIPAPAPDPSVAEK